MVSSHSSDPWDLGPGQETRHPVPSHPVLHPNNLAVHLMKGIIGCERAPLHCQGTFTTDGASHGQAPLSLFLLVFQLPPLLGRGSHIMRARYWNQRTHYGYSSSHTSSPKDWILVGFRLADCYGQKQFYSDPWKHTRHTEYTSSEHKLSSLPFFLTNFIGFSFSHWGQHCGPRELRCSGVPWDTGKRGFQTTASLAPG